MSLSDIHARQTQYMDAMVAAFEHHLEEIIRKAQARLAGKLQERLSITDGVIDQTPGNIRALRNLNDLFMAEMNAAGYGKLVEVFVGEFQGQLPFLEEVIQYLSGQMKAPLPPLKWNSADRGVFAGFGLNAQSSLETVMESAAGTAMTRAMFSVGGLKFADLIETLADRFAKSIPQATTIADTAMATFYATASDRAFRHIEEDLPEQEQRYRYFGPVDKLERPFCRHLTDADKAYTRAQIDRMDNGQLPNVFITRGGWRCRHWWITDVRDLALEEAA